MDLGALDCSGDDDEVVVELAHTVALLPDVMSPSRRVLAVSALTDFLTVMGLRAPHASHSSMSVLPSLTILVSGSPHSEQMT